MLQCWRLGGLAGCGGKVLSPLLIARRHLAAKRAHAFSSSLSWAYGAFSESPGRPGGGSARTLFYEFPLGQGCGLPEVLISCEQNINHVSCNLFHINQNVSQSQTIDIWQLSKARIRLNHTGKRDCLMCFQLVGRR